MNFKGFKKNVKYIPIPAPIFDTLLESMSNISELKLMLRIMWLLQIYNRKPQFITENEIITDKLTSKLIGGSDKVIESLCTLENYGIIKSSKQKSDGIKIIFLNSETIKDRIAKSDLLIETNQTDPWEKDNEIPNIYSIYEQNIGMITPHIAELIKESENLYPVEWVEDAIKHASKQNKRSWAYIESILNRWKIEGRDNGEYSRHNRQTRYR